MNKDTHDRIYPIIKKRDGEYCRACGKILKEITEDKFLIDHKDNDNSNNKLYNLQLLCRSCNYFKNPKAELSELDELEISSELKKGEIMEGEFRRWVFGRIMLDGTLLVEEAVYSGAEIIKGSPVSTQRYVKKMKSPAGLYEIVKLQDSRKYLRFKPEYR